jgi:hypothetical protein
MPVPDFDLDVLLGRVEKILLKKKPKPPDPTTVALCEVIASLVIEVARLRARVPEGEADPEPENSSRSES